MAHPAINHRNGQMPRLKSRERNSMYSTMFLPNYKVKPEISHGFDQPITLVVYEFTDKAEKGITAPIFSVTPLNWGQGCDSEAKLPDGYCKRVTDETILKFNKLFGLNIPEEEKPDLKKMLDMLFEKYKNLKGSFSEWSKLANQVGYDGPGLNSQEPYKYIFNVSLDIREKTKLRIGAVDGQHRLACFTHQFEGLPISSSPIYEDDPTELLVEFNKYKTIPRTSTVFQSPIATLCWPKKLEWGDEDEEFLEHMRALSKAKATEGELQQNIYISDTMSKIMAALRKEDKEKYWNWEKTDFMGRAKMYLGEEIKLLGKT